MNLLRQLIDGSVGGSTDKDGAAMELDQLVDDDGRGNRLPGPGGPWIRDRGRYSVCFTAYTYTKHTVGIRYWYHNITCYNYARMYGTNERSQLFSKM